MSKFSYFVLGVFVTLVLLQIIPAFAQEVTIPITQPEPSSQDWVHTTIGDNGVPFVGLIWILSKLVERLKGFETSAKDFVGHQEKYLDIKQKHLEKSMERDKELCDAVRVMANALAAGHGVPVDVRGSIYTKLDPSGGHDPEAVSSHVSRPFSRSSSFSRAASDESLSESTQTLP